MGLPNGPNQLSSGELEIMEILWKEGAVSLSETHRKIGRKIGYTTVQTRLNRLVEKGIVSRTLDRPAKYVAAIAPQKIADKHLGILLKRVGDENLVPLVVQLVKQRKLTGEELEKLKSVIRETEETG